MGFYGETEEINDLIFAYLTSSLFLLDTFEKSRSRSGEFIIIYQTDFFRLFLFPDFAKIIENNDVKEEILQASLEYNSKTPIKDRPMFTDAIKKARINQVDPLRKLDEAWMRALELPLEYLDSFYQEIEERLKEMVSKKGPK